MLLLVDQNEPVDDIYQLLWTWMDGEAERNDSSVVGSWGGAAPSSGAASSTDVVVEPMADDSPVKEVSSASSDGNIQGAAKPKRKGSPEADALVDGRSLRRRHTV